MPDESITAGEFARFRVDLSARLGELSTRFDRQDRSIDEGFRGVHRRQDEANGRTTKNSEKLIKVETHLDTIQAQVESINAKAERVEPIAAEVSEIRQHGCAQLEHHAKTIAQINGVSDVGPAGWDRKKKAMIGSGLIAGGAALWPVLQGILAAVHALLDHLVGP